MQFTAMVCFGLVRCLHFMCHVSERWSIYVWFYPSFARWTNRVSEMKWNGILADVRYACALFMLNAHRASPSYLFCYDCVSILFREIWLMLGSLWSATAKIQYAPPHHHKQIHDLFLFHLYSNRKFSSAAEKRNEKKESRTVMMVLPALFIRKIHKQIETSSSIIIKLNSPVVVSHAQMSKWSHQSFACLMCIQLFVFVFSCHTPIGFLPRKC